MTMYKRSPDIIITDLADELILLDSRRGEMFGSSRASRSRASRNSLKTTTPTGDLRMTNMAPRSRLGFHVRFAHAIQSLGLVSDTIGGSTKTLICDG